MMSDGSDSKQTSYSVDFISFFLLIDRGVLVLLVLRDQIVHVRLSLGELHLVHALCCEPVQKGLPPEHGRELLAHALEHLLDSGAVADEGGRHLETAGRDVADCGLDVVGNPLHKVGRVLVGDIEHLLFHLLGAHSSSEDGRGGQVSAVTRVSSAHHVLGIEHLLGQLRDSQRTVALTASRGKRHEPDHEEVKSRERDEVDSQFPEVRVELTWEPDAASDS